MITGDCRVVLLRNPPRNDSTSSPSLYPGHSTFTSFCTDSIKTLEELNQAQITLYNAWEKPAMPGNRTWLVSGIEYSIVSRANQPIDFVRLDDIKGPAEAALLTGWKKSIK